MIARALLYAILFGVIFEVTCRIEDLVRYGTPVLSPYSSQTDLILQDSTGARGRPHARFQKWVLNNIGTRGPDVMPTKTPRVLRVVTAGASETFGLYESPAREYPRQLQDSLSSRLSVMSCNGQPAYTSAEVINAALPGMSLPTVLADLRHRIAALAPDVVVYYPTPSQYLDEFVPGTAPTRPRTGDTSRNRVFYPRAVARLRSQAKTMLPDVAQTWLRQRDVASVIRAHPAGWRFAAMPNDRAELYERDLRRLVGAVRAAGAVPVLATNSNAFLGTEPGSSDLLFAWERSSPRASGPVILAFDSLGRQMVRAVARDSSVALADVEANVRGPAMFADYLHFTDKGAAIVAGVMARTIAEQVARTRCPASVTTSGTPADAPDYGVRRVVSR
jgi:lysophospholipase L1-like esterase